MIHPWLKKFLFVKKICPALLNVALCSHEQTKNYCLFETDLRLEPGRPRRVRKYDLPYEDRDIINDPLQRQEMIEKSGQMLSPCVEINGQMLPDISGEEVEAWMLANNIVTPNDITPDAPINQPCAHEMPQSAPLNFAVRR